MEGTPPDVEHTVAIINLGLAVLCASIAYPLFTGMVTRNKLFGFRTTKSMASDEAWYEANRLLATCLFVGASVIAVINGFYLAWGFPLPEAMHDDLLMYSTPVGLLVSGGVAWLLHQRD